MSNTSNNQTNVVTIHPLVMLSAVDHYNRVASNTSKRCVGVLLGQRSPAAAGQSIGQSGWSVNVANSFALPFEEDETASRNGSDGVWFLDHNYLENMFEMFKKINASERIIGWYHTGPKLRSSDLEINKVISRYCTQPVLLVIDLKRASGNGNTGLPVDAYVAVEEIHDDGTAATFTFNHIPAEIAAEESEEIGVEHLLRDVSSAESVFPTTSTNTTHKKSSSSATAAAAPKDNQPSSSTAQFTDDSIAAEVSETLSTRINHIVNSLRGLAENLYHVQQYLVRVADNKLPICHPILYNIQTIMNLLPQAALSETGHEQQVFHQALATSTNDRLAVTYVASLVRAVLALHNLIDNKLQQAQWESKHEQLNAAPSTSAVVEG